MPDSRLAAVVKRVAVVPLVLSLVLLVSSEGCKRRIVAPKIVPPTPDEIRDLIAQVSAKKRSVGMAGDLRGAAATRLGQAGPAGKEAIPALEKLANAKDADENTKKVAEEALAKIRGSESAAQ